MQLLPFDSELFDYPVYTFSLNKINAITAVAEIAADLIQKKGKLLYLYLEEKADFESIETPEYSILFVDEKVNYNCLINETDGSQTTTSFSEPKINNDGLLSLAYESGQFSRFKVDPNFINNEFEQLYKLWLGKSLSREIEGIVYTVDTEGISKGLISLNTNEETQHATIGLLAVDRNCQGQGVGRTLVEKAKQFTHAQELLELKVATQRNNMGACRFYEKTGFKEESNVFIYHLWIK